MPIEDPERRRGNLSFEPGTGVLVVGARTAVLDRAPTPEVLLGSYVELVVAQRDVAPRSHVDLRNRELVQLSALLELRQDELDALIDRELARLLGGTGAGVVLGTGRTATDASGSVAALGRRRRLVLASLAVGGLAVGGVVVASLADGAATGTGTGTGTGVGTGTEEIIGLPDGGTATRTESDVAPVGEDGTDVGTAVVIERNP